MSSGSVVTGMDVHRGVLRLVCCHYFGMDGPGPLVFTGTSSRHRLLSNGPNCQASLTRQPPTAPTTPHGIARQVKPEPQRGSHLRHQQDRTASCGRSPSCSTANTDRTASCGASTLPQRRGRALVTKRAHGSRTAHAVRAPCHWSQSVKRKFTSIGEVQYNVWLLTSGMRSRKTGLSRSTRNDKVCTSTTPQSLQPAALGPEVATRVVHNACPDQDTPRPTQESSASSSTTLANPWPCKTSQHIHCTRVARHDRKRWKDRTQRLS